MVQSKQKKGREKVETGGKLKSDRKKNDKRK